MTDAATTTTTIELGGLLGTVLAVVAFVVRLILQVRAQTARLEEDLLRSTGRSSDADRLQHERQNRPTLVRQATQHLRSFRSNCCKNLCSFGWSDTAASTPPLGINSHPRQRSNSISSTGSIFINSNSRRNSLSADIPSV